MAGKPKPHPPLFRGSPHLKQWQKCYDEWLLTMRERSGSVATVASYRCECEHLFIDQRRSPEQYSREEIVAFIRRPSSRSGKPPAPDTQNRRLATLQSFFNFAGTYYVSFRSGQRPLLNKVNPCQSIRPVRPGRKPKGLTADELKRFFAAIPRETIKDKRDFALFSFYFWTARRRAEILRLTWGDIVEITVLEEGNMHRRHVYRYSAKGHSRDVFTAALPHEAYAALLDYLQSSGRLDNMRPESPLFTSSYRQVGGEHALNVTSVNVIIHRYAEAAGLQVGRQITPHWLRHTRAQLQWLDDPSDHALKKIQKLLGHEDIGTTMLYLAGAEEKPDDGAARLAARLGKL